MQQRRQRVVAADGLAQRVVAGPATRTARLLRDRMSPCHPETRASGHSEGVGAAAPLPSETLTSRDWSPPASSVA